VPDEAAAYEALKERLGDRNWRLDNLYWIQDEKGDVVRFVRNEAQKSYWAERWYLNLILKARQLGFSTLIAIDELDTCLFNSNTAAGIIDLTREDAKKKLGKIKFAYNRLPESIRAAIPLVKDSTEELSFANGSHIQVGTSHRGGTLQVLHVSEFGKISAQHPEKAREIKTGAFGTVHPGQMAHVESTAEGASGEFYDQVQRAEAAQKEGRPLSQIDFKLHFFAWFRHAGYRLDPRTVTIPIALEEYFAELKAKHGVNLDAEQKAWYAAKRYQIGPDDMFREYPSIPEEAFNASIEGAYFKRQMSKARTDGRIGDVPHDPARKVNTWWDIGRDTTSIWFHQTDGLRHRLIDYYENSGESIGHYAAHLAKVKEERKFLYGQHLGPHDLQVADWGGEGKTRWQKASDLGIEFDVVPRVDDKDDAIEEARSMLGLCWIDRRRCERGIQCLDNYRKEWDEKRSTWKSQPRHDWACHGADSYMTGAMGFVPEFVKREERGRRGGKGASQKSAWGV
jgi:hypothetical protein